jgi:hypothetical protein
MVGVCEHGFEPLYSVTMNFLTGPATTNFSRKILHQRVSELVRDIFNQEIKI